MSRIRSGAAAIAVPIALLSAGSAAAAPIPNPSRAADPHVINVKFRDGTDVEARAATVDFASATLRARLGGLLGPGTLASARSPFKGSPDELRAERIRLQRRGKSVPDLAAWVQVRVDAGQDPVKVLSELRADPAVSVAYVAPPAIVPPPAVRDLWVYQQTQWSDLGIPESGSVPDAIGEGVKLVDVEQGFNENHEDLTGPAPGGGTVTRYTPNYPFEGLELPADQVAQLTAHAIAHGTSTATVIVARPDGAGMNGIAPGTKFGFWSESDRPAAIDSASRTVGAGGVLLLEMQSTCGGCTNNPPALEPFVPAESDPLVAAAVARAVASGVIVVAAAGNGNVNLDTEPEVRDRFNRSVDTGAIIVGQGTPSAPYSRVGDSTYGSRVDVHAPPAALAGGYPLFAGSSTPSINDDYYGPFGGTSGATAIAGGITAALAGAYKSRTGALLDGAKARRLLVASGTAQATPENGHIGPRLHLTRALDAIPVTSVGGASGFVSDPRPTFTFSSPSLPAGNTFECRIVSTEPGAAVPSFGPCSGTSSHQPATALPDGPYRFEARVVTAYGLVDPSPATRDFGVLSTTGTGTAGVVSYSAGAVLASGYGARENELAVSGNGSSILVDDGYEYLRASTGCTQVSISSVSCAPAAGSVINEVQVAAGDGDDSIFSSASVETYLYGGNGNDVITGVGTGRDNMSGGAGTDTVSFAGRPTAVTISKNGVADDGPAGGTPDFVASDLETLIGGNGNDTLRAGSAGTRLEGGMGNDLIYGGAGNDALLGEAGDDYLYGGTGVDTIDGASGADRLVAADGVVNDQLTCGTGADLASFDLGDTFVDLSACESLFEN